MEGKSSTQNGAFSLLYLSIVRAESPDSEFDFFNQQIAAKLPKNAYQMTAFLENVFSTLIGRFFAKNQKIF